MFEGPVCASLLVFHVKHKHTGPFHVEHTPMMLQPRYSGYFGLGLARLRDLRTGAAFSPPSRAASGAARLKPGSAFIAFTCGRSFHVEQAHTVPFHVEQMALSPAVAAVEEDAGARLRNGNGALPSPCGFLLDL
jgi:hypothetical protein